MRNVMISLVVGILSLFAAQTAAAACFADYKAKQEKPLRLHYGVVEVAIQPCRLSRAVTDHVAQRVSAGGWTLLKVETVFDETGLEARKRDAGEYYLRY